MNNTQLRAYLTDHLKEAEPLTSPSTIEDPQAVATSAVKKLALLGLGNLLDRAYRVEDNRAYATVLAECLALLPADSPNHAPFDWELLTVEQAASRMNISPRSAPPVTDRASTRSASNRSCLSPPLRGFSFQFLPYQGLRALAIDCRHFVAEEMNSEWEAGREWVKGKEVKCAADVRACCGLG